MMIRVCIVGLLLMSCKVRPALQPASGAVSWVTSSDYEVRDGIASLSFGTIYTGESKNVCLALSNVGSAAITIELGVFEAPFDWAPFSGVSMQPGETKPICVSFQPTERGHFDTQLIVRISGAENTAELVASVAGDAIEPGCQVRLDAAEIDFGVVLPNEYLTRQLKLFNEGDVTCAWRVALDVDGGSRFWFEAPTDSALAPGDEQRVVITTLGAEAGETFAAELILSWTDPEGVSTETHIPLTAKTVPDCFAVSPSLVDFGVQRAGCAVARRVKVFNICAQALNVSAVQDLTGRILVGDAGAGFVVERSLDVGDDGLGIGEFAVTTQSAANIDGLVRLTLPWGSRFVPVRGVVTSESRHTDHFKQRAPLVDVVFGYAPHLYSIFGFEQLSQFSERLIARLRSLQADVHLGGIHGYWNVPMSPLSPDAFGTWREGELISLGAATYANGSDVDAGALIADLFSDIPMSEANQALEYSNYLEMDLRALMPPLSIGANSGFRRKNAELVFVHTNMTVDASTRWRPVNGSSNMDDWPWEYPVPTDYYMARFEQVLDGDSSMFINHLASDAGYSQQWDALRVIERGVSQTGGALLEFGNPDGAGVADAVMEKYRQFRLTGQPALAPGFQISVDGAQLSDAEWSYVAATNTITLVNRPSVNSTIDISYALVDCR